MNRLYAKPREQFLTALFNWPSMSVCLMAWRGAYVFNEAHLTAADILANGGTLVQVSLLMTGKAVGAGGYAKSDTVVFPAMPVGPAVTFMTITTDEVTDAANKLIYHIDTAQVLPFIPNGLDQWVVPDWSNGQGWFRP